MTSSEPHEVYDAMAEDYAETNPPSPARAEYEWPGVRALLPDLDGKRVLDAACGSGYYSARFAERGATVVGVDASEEMLAVARADHGDEVTFQQADLREPLDFEDGAFDVVVVQLALDHLEEWTPVTTEFARVLRDGGHLVVSCDHPFSTYYVIDEEPDDVGNATANEADYYEVESFEKVWGEGEDATHVPWYRRSLADTLGPLFAAGFVLEDLVEPTPTDSFEFLDYFLENTPRFLALRARKDG